MQSAGNSPVLSPGSPTRPPSPAQENEDICKNVQRTEAYFLIDGGMRPVYALPKQDRVRHIPAEMDQYMQNPGRGRRWTIRCFKHLTSSLEEREAIEKGECWKLIGDAAQREPASDSELKIESPDSTEAECFYWKPRPAPPLPPTQAMQLRRQIKTEKSHIDLPSASCAQRKQLAIYNGGQEAVEIRNAGNKKTYSLGSQEGVVFQQGEALEQPEWQGVLAYVFTSPLLPTNPLTIEGKPLFLDSRDRLIYSRPGDGEPFLPLRMIIDLVEGKRPTGETALQYSSFSGLEQALRDSRSDAGYVAASG